MSSSSCRGDGRRSRLLAVGLLAVGVGFWTGCSETLLAVSDSGEAHDTAFHQLALLEVSSGRLSHAITEQADAVGYSHQLERQSELASPLTVDEITRIEQAFVHALKVMLFDLAPTNFWESRLTEYYTTTLPVAEAQRLVDEYEHQDQRPSSWLQELRESFIKDRLPDLLPVVRARSQRFQIPSEAMVPTLLPGDHVMVHRAAYQEAIPQQGDIIVYRYPDEDGQRFLHRVIGVPGDVIEIRDQVVSVNQEVLAEPYMQHTDRSGTAGNVRDHLGPITVPPESYFVLGDNREESLDSRFLGPISKEHIVGRVLFVYWSVDPSTKTPRWDRLNQLVR